MNKRIMSGSGSGVNYTGDWVIIIIAVGVTFIFGFVLANIFGYTEYWRGRYVRNDAYYIILYGSWFVAVIEFCIYAYVISKCKKTEIYVYENTIEGIGLGSSEYVTAELTNFKLGYDKIASVDVTKRIKLSLNAYGKAYIIFLYNAHLYAEEINKRMKLDNHGGVNASGSNSPILNPNGIVGEWRCPKCDTKNASLVLNCKGCGKTK